MSLCQVGRNYDPNHPTCRTCQVGCPYNVIVISKKTGKHATLPEVTEQIPPVEKQPPAGRKQTKTETEYGTRLSFEFPGCKIRFEALTLHLDNGHAYTADWVVFLPDGKFLLVEVKARGKDGYQQPSYQRAKVMFDQSRLEFPMWSFRWAEKQSGEWMVTNY
jgi:hypothetical protein